MTPRAARRIAPSATVSTVVHPPAREAFTLVRSDVRADERGRITIGPSAPAQQQYQVMTNALGQILLDPVVTIPARELWLFQNKGALQSVVRGVHEARAGALGTWPSFAKFAETDDGDADTK